MSAPDANDASRASNHGSGPEPEVPPQTLTVADPLAPKTGTPSLGGQTAESRDAPSTAPAELPIPSIPGYQIEGILGRGGMGVVYRARQIKANRVVALKMILQNRYASVHDQVRFQIEAEAVAGLQHPHIAQLYEVGEHDGMPFFSLEFCDGGALDQKLKTWTATAAEAAALVETLARAIHYAHLRGVVHRDLKPANVLLAGDGTPKIGDFGLAKKLDSGNDISQSGAIMGTPSYMAPEQASGKVHDTGPAADVYALGALLYELLARQPPFRGATTFETLRQVLTEEPVPPSQLAPRESRGANWRDLETVCLKCLRKEPEGRYASAEALANDLRRWQAGEPIHARPVGSAERLVKWVRRNPLVAALLALVGVTLAGGTAGIYVKYRDAEAQRQLAEENAEKATRETEQKEEALRAQQKARGELEEELANGQVQLAQAAWDKGDVAGARAILGQVPGPLRRWEWHYLRRAFEGGLFPLYGHTSKVFGVAFSPDGTRLATTSRDRTARLWDARTGAPQLVLRGHTEMVQGVAFSPDGTRLATGAWDGTARLWDARTGAALLTIQRTTGGVQGVAFSPDSTRLVTGHQDLTARLWDVRTGACVLTFQGPGGVVQAVAFSPDGTCLATAGDLVVRLWDTRTGKLLRQLKGHSGLVQGLAFSPDGSQLASASQDNTVRLWDRRTGAVLRQFQEHPMMVTGLAFSPDGTRLATGCPDGVVRLWDVRTGALLRPFKGHTAPVFGVAFSPDGARLASAAGDGTARLWDVRSAGTPLAFQWHAELVGAVAFTPDGTRLATVSHDRIARLWDVLTGQPLGAALRHPDPGAPVALSTDGGRLATGGSDGVTRLWDAHTGELLRVFKGHTKTVNGVAFSPDGSSLATASDDQTARLWDARTGVLLRHLDGQTLGVTGLAFSPDGSRLATACKDGTARLWDVTSGALAFELKGHTAALLGLTFSPDGRRLATAGGDRTARVWDARTGALHLELRGHRDCVSAVAFSPDGSRLATASWDKTARLWDARTGAALVELTGHGALLRGVAFSPDGARLVTASDDRTVRLWDGRPGADPLELKGHTFTVVAVAFSPDGMRLSTWDSMGRGIVWDLRTGRALPEPPAAPVHEPREPDGGLSADGRRLALLDASLVRVVDVSPPAAGELAARRWATSSDPFWHLAEAEHLLGEGQASAAAFHLGRSGDLPTTSTWLLRRGDLAARLGQWRPAQADLVAAWKQLPADLWVGRRVALAGLAGGEIADYRRACIELRRGWGTPAEATVAGLLFAGRPGDALTAAVAPLLAADVCAPYRGRMRGLVVRTCVLPAEEPREIQGLLWLARQDSLASGAVLCRAGRHAEAVRALAGGTDFLSQLWRARAECGLGRPDAARVALNEAEEWLTSLGDLTTHTKEEQLPWDTRLEVQQLRKEVEAYLLAQKK